MEICKEHCRLAQYCYRKGYEGLNPEECANYYKIEDLLWDAECERMEERMKEREEPEDLDDWNE